MPFATASTVDNGTPSDLQSLLIRLGAVEKELAGLKAENTRLKAELARKDKIIAGPQQRLFGSSSEKLDPAQLQFELDQLLLGKPAPPPDPSGTASARSSSTRPTKPVHPSSHPPRPATSVPSTKPSEPNSSRPPRLRSTKPPSTISHPATALSAKAASGPTAS